jgi:hypothetical protein
VQNYKLKFYQKHKEQKQRSQAKKLQMTSEAKNFKTLKNVVLKFVSKTLKTSEVEDIRS